MRIYPSEKEKPAEEAPLSATARVTRQVALIIAFISVFGFFVKLLFF